MRKMFVLFYRFYWFIPADRAFPYIIKTFSSEFNQTVRGLGGGRGLRVGRGGDKKPREKYTP